MTYSNEKNYHYIIIIIIIITIIITGIDIIIF